MRAYAVAAVLVASPAAAEDWVALDGARIKSALEGRSLDYGNATQDFSTSGSTNYTSSRPTRGQWAVRGDQYCSVWPPSDDWACYDVDLSVDGTQVRFRRGASDVTVGTYVKTQ